jgi:uroporphyrin-III C-methyltransferase/precorrin-2 dehydrogenase/sirohydrochlorin ferrochelatase
MSQDTIHRLMIRAARRGLRVVRLKGGDPFVFGRGGEEAVALRAAGVPFEVIPGVTSAVAAPALSGIPVTHRGLTSAFTVVSGHARSSYEPVFDAVRPGTMTLVVMMGTGAQIDIASALIARGWPASTPAAIAYAASREDAETWTGTLASLQRGDGPVDPARPGTLVIGEVVKLRDVLTSGLNAGAIDPAESEEQVV